MENDRICDRCGIKYQINETDDCSLDDGIIQDVNPGENFDLCSKCYIEFIEWMTNPKKDK